MRYISEDAISFSIRIEGRENSLRVNFSPVSSGGSTYSTDFPAAIKALEGSPMFGKVYFRAPECVGVTEEQPKKVVKKRVIKVSAVKEWQDAAEYLVEKFGARPEALTTPDAIREEAEKNNVLFPELD